MTFSNTCCRRIAALGLAAGLCTAQDTTKPADKERSGSTASQDTAKPADRNRTNTTTTQEGSHATDSTRNRTNPAASSEVMVNQQDAMFMKETAMGGMMEVQAAQTAQQKATSAEVKQFATKLEQDHTKANEELKALAKKKNVDLPADMGPKHQAHLAKMQNASNFDRTWVKMQVDHHKKDVSNFQKQSNRTMDSDVKAFVDKTLPTLQAHLDELQKLNMSKK